MRNTKIARVAAAFGAAAVATLSFTAAAAGAVDTGYMPDPAKDGSSSLTIHKRDGEPTNLPHNGLAVTGDLPGEPLEGAEFTIQALTCGTPDVLDLTTNDGWTMVTAIYKEVGTSNPTAAALKKAGEKVTKETCSFGQSITKATGENGEAVFGNLPFGVYHVTETSTPEGYKPVLPFLVTVPMTHPTDLNSWVYDVHVYPKDRPQPSKEVNDEETASTMPEVGDLVEWTVKTPAPYHKEGTKGFYMSDSLDPRLAYARTDSVQICDAAHTPSSCATLARGTDYVINVYAGTGQTVRMELTQSGIDKLDAAVKTDPSVYVYWTFGTYVLDTGAIENEATIFENKPSTGSVPGEGTGIEPPEVCDEEDPTYNPVTGDCNELPRPPEVCDETDPNWNAETSTCFPGTPTPPPTSQCDEDDPTWNSETQTCGEPTGPTKPVTKWGKISLVKKGYEDGAQSDSNALAGAEFKVQSSTTSAEHACSKTGKDTGVTATTDANGKATLKPLRASDWANNEQLTVTKDDNGNDVYPEGWIFYCLIETKAPAGFELLPEGIPFDIVTGGMAAENTEFEVDGGTVWNIEKNAGFELPLTGGIGTIIFLVIGGVIVVGAISYAQRSAKKQQTSQVRG